MSQHSMNNMANSFPAPPPMHLGLHHKNNNSSAPSFQPQMQNTRFPPGIRVPVPGPNGMQMRPLASGPPLFQQQYDALQSDWSVQDMQHQNSRMAAAMQNFQQQLSKNFGPQKSSNTFQQAGSNNNTMLCKVSEAYSTSDHKFQQAATSNVQMPVLRPNVTPFLPFWNTQQSGNGDDCANDSWQAHKTAPKHGALPRHPVRNTLWVPPHTDNAPPAEYRNETSMSRQNAAITTSASIRDRHVDENDSPIKAFIGAVSGKASSKVFGTPVAQRSNEENFFSSAAALPFSPCFFESVSPAKSSKNFDDNGKNKGETNDCYFDDGNECDVRQQRGERPTFGDISSIGNKQHAQPIHQKLSPASQIRANTRWHPYLRSPPKAASLDKDGAFSFESDRFGAVMSRSTTAGGGYRLF